ncbi:hypothetical protein BD779DRAFT_222929 [Infundibulicybe gibba]|nr:hypothetical protein BD779DRAFT_222929 [Infundibulicybe gibba]
MLITGTLPHINIAPHSLAAVTHGPTSRKCQIPTTCPKPAGCGPSSCPRLLGLGLIEARPKISYRFCADRTRPDNVSRRIPGLCILARDLRCPTSSHCHPARLTQEGRPCEFAVVPREHTIFQALGAHPGLLRAPRCQRHTSARAQPHSRSNFL